MERFFRLYEFDGSFKCGLLQQGHPWLLEETRHCHGGDADRFAILPFRIWAVDHRTLGHAGHIRGVQIRRRHSFSLEHCDLVGWNGVFDVCGARDNESLFTGYYAALAMVYAGQYFFGGEHSIGFRGIQSFLEL